LLYGDYSLQESLSRRNDALKKKPVQFDINGNYIAAYDSEESACKAVGASSGSVGLCCNSDEHCTVKGYIWLWEHDKEKISDYFYKDNYCNEISFEKAEQRLNKTAINGVIKNISLNDIGLFIGSDLLNQISSSNYIMRDYDVPFIGTYSACAASGLNIILVDRGHQSEKVLSETKQVVLHNFKDVLFFIKNKTN
jgi:hypothetical protein